jgi:hypothetical protein
VSQQALFVVTRVTGVFLRELKISSDVTLGESEKIIKKNCVGNADTEDEMDLLFSDKKSDDDLLIV